MFLIFYVKFIFNLKDPFVKWLGHNFFTVKIRVQILYGLKKYFHRGYSLIGKTAILHIVISGSRPDISIKLKDYISQLLYYLYYTAQEAQLVERNSEDV